MTFTDAVYAVDGGRITGQLFRQNLQAATYRGEGIIQPTDLEVRELTTPGSSVRILDGDGVILGREVGNQGSYFFTNNGEEEAGIGATGTGEVRSDLIVARSEDPTFSGSPWTHDPATTRIVWPRVIPDVPPGTRKLQEVNPGESGFAMARIDMPESTATVTQALITDLRPTLILNPSFQDSIQHSSSAEALTSGSFVNWPVEANTQVTVPTWATRMDISAMLTGIQGKSTNPTPHNVFGAVRVTVNDVSQGLQTGFNTEWPSGVTNVVVGHGQTISVADLQGQVVSVKLQGRIGGGDGFLEADEWTAILWSFFFRQTPEFNF